MGINATLFGQMITFLIFIWFTKKFVWPPLTKALEERQARIADGLAAAERGQRELEEADAKVSEILKEARLQASQIIEQAERRGSEIVEEARGTAQESGDRMLEQAQAEIEQERNRLKESLRGEVAAIALAGAQQILEKEISADEHRVLLDKLAAKL